MPNIKLNDYIKSLSFEDRNKEIKKLCHLFPEVKEYYKAKLLDSGETTLLEKYVRIINEEFRSNDHPGRSRLSVARKAINDFLRISTDDLNKAEIMVQYVEAGVRFTNAYGDINGSFYDSMTAMLDKALKYISIRKMKGVFRGRVKQMVADTENVGWGFHDDISELFSRYFQS